MNTSKRSPLSLAAMGAATLALATAFTFAPAAVGVGPFDDAAYAKGKGGNDKGDRGNRGGGNGGNGKSDNAAGKKDRSSKSAAKSSPGQLKKAERMAAVSAEGDFQELHPSRKGKWNASNASQNALDAHIRNGNFNGTIGALAQYQLAAKAAEDYDSLSDTEKAALENFVSFEDIEISDEEYAELLNGDGSDDLDGDGLNDTLPNFEVVDGVATCTSNCDAEGFDPETIDDDANDLISEYTEIEQEASDQAALDEFFGASEDRIIAESNKTYTEEEQDLLFQGLDRDLGVNQITETTDTTTDG